MPGTLAPTQRRSAILRLENGDRLTRREFERRYSAMPQVKKAELIEGTVYLPSQVRIDGHAEPHLLLALWAGRYAASANFFACAADATIRLDGENEPQPDVLLRLKPEAGGQARTSEDGYLEGAPEFIAEVAASSASYDLHDKKRAYRRNGVSEYLVWLAEEERLEWWELKDGEYVNLPADQGLIKSRTFPGLWLNSLALFQRDSAAVLQTLEEGISSPEHQRFLETLRAGAAGQSS